MAFIIPTTRSAEPVYEDLLVVISTKVCDGTDARGVDSARETRRRYSYPMARVGSVNMREALSLAEPLKPWQSLSSPW